MELIWIILAIFAIYIFVKYILPIIGIFAGIILAIGIGYALVLSIYGFLKSFIKNRDPYATFVDKNTDIPLGLKRGYFFGPGLHQIKNTIKDAFETIIDQAFNLTSFRIDHTDNAWYLDMWVWIFYIPAISATYVFGFAWISVFSLVFVSVVITGLCIFYVMFTILWVMDRFILALRSIHSRCSKCKRISIVPVFICPDCGVEHRKLTPGPYGTFHRKCTCKKELPTTFLNGRSALKATCPYCTTELAASDARQYGIQLIGGVSAGKTTFLAAFWHLYLERIKKLYSITIEEYPIEAFHELEHWYRQGLSSSTTEINANMYSVIHKLLNETPYQLTIYDIAGEAFSDFSGNVQQQQFKYCEGLIFVLDPTALPKDVNDTFSGFIHEFKGLKGKHSMKTSDIPAAVVISKADLFKREIGLPKIKSRYNSNQNEFSTTEIVGSLECTRNGVSREFLVNHVFENVLNLLESEFTNVQYYPVSAMGHTAVSGQKYEPWGVMEPVLWLLRYGNNSIIEVTKKIQEEVSN
jgi:GTPase SAR1 family protein